MILSTIKLTPHPATCKEQQLAVVIMLLRVASLILFCLTAVWFCPPAQCICNSYTIRSWAPICFTAFIVLEWSKEGRLVFRTAWLITIPHQIEDGGGSLCAFNGHLKFISSRCCVWWNYHRLLLFIGTVCENNKLHSSWSACIAWQTFSFIDINYNLAQL